MSQTVPATCVLGPGKTGLTIGLRVLNLDGTTYAAFATTGVTETSVAGTYRKAGGVVVPAAGGYIVWGEAATDYAEATVDGTSVNVTHHAGVAVAAADADGNVPVDVKLWKGSAPSDLDANSYVRVDVLAWDSDPVDERYPYVTPVDSSDGVNTIDYLYIRDAMKLAPSAGAPAAGSVDAHLDALALEATAQAILTDTGTALPALISATGSGVWTIEITVNNGTTVLENAKVQLSEGANRFVGETNESGVVTFNVDAATYIVAIAKTGYSYSGTTLVVSDDVSITYSMSINSFTSSLPGQSTGWVYCYNYNGDIEASVTIYVQQVATTETSGYAFDTTIYTLTSDENGLVEATGLWIGATYQAKRVNGAWHSFVVPDAATFALPAMLGR